MEFEMGQKSEHIKTDIKFDKSIKNLILDEDNQTFIVTYAKGNCGFEWSKAPANQQVFFSAATDYEQQVCNGFLIRINKVSNTL